MPIDPQLHSKPKIKSIDFEKKQFKRMLYA